MRRRSGRGVPGKRRFSRRSRGRCDWSWATCCRACRSSLCGRASMTFGKSCRLTRKRSRLRWHGAGWKCRCPSFPSNAPASSSSARTRRTKSSSGCHCRSWWSNSVCPSNLWNPRLLCRNPGPICRNSRHLCRNPGHLCRNPRLLCRNPGPICRNSRHLCRNPGLLCRNPRLLCRNPRLLCRNPRLLCRNRRLLCRNRRLLCRNRRLLCRNRRLLCRNRRLLCRNRRLLCRNSRCRGKRARQQRSPPQNRRRCLHPKPRSRSMATSAKTLIFKSLSQRVRAFRFWPRCARRYSVPPFQRRRFLPLTLRRRRGASPCGLSGFSRRR